MLYARDFRAIARDRLRGCFWPAVLVTFVATLLGGAVTMMRSTPAFANTSSYRFDQFTDIPELYALLNSPRIVALFLIASLWSIAIFLIGGAVSVGLCRYYLAMNDHQERSLRTLWTGFSVFGKALGVVLLSALYTFLWTLLFIIPGIIAAYRYSMALFVLAEDPSVGVNEAISISKRMMHGNKWRLFCLGFSFLGWLLLASIPSGVAIGVSAVLMLSDSISLLPFGIVFVIGMLLTLLASFCLVTYQNAAFTAFYLEVSGQRPRLNVEVVNG